MFKKISTLSLLSLSFIVLSADDQNTTDIQSDETQLSDIRVTSDFRVETTESEVPASLTVLDEDSLQQAGQQHFQDVLNLVPNINWSGSTSRPRYFQIRGIGERSQYEGAPNPSVGFIIDDMDFTGIGGAATLFDIEHIEVLRGPQGTRYGANALAGLIYVQSKAPQTEKTYHGRLSVGQNGIASAGFSAAGAMGHSETNAYRLTVHQYQSDGFRHNAFLNRDDTDGKDELTLRGKFHVQINDNWQSDLSLLMIDQDNGFDVWTPTHDFTTYSNDLGIDAQKAVGGSWKNTWTTAAFDVVSITAITDADITYFFDGDWGNNEYWGEYAPYEYALNNDRERRHTTQEFRLLSNQDSRVFKGRSDWLLGLYLSRLDEDNHSLEASDGVPYRDFSSHYQADKIAVFGQLDSHLTEKTTLTTGLRFEQRKADYSDDNALKLKPKDDMLGGQISLKHQLNKHHNLYATVARGFKAGGFNLSTTLPDSRRSYDPEYLINYEIGSKAFLFDYRLQLNTALFYSKRKDMQVSTSFQSDPNDPLTYIYYTGNAAEGENYGLEMDALWQVNRNLSLHGSLGYLKAQYTDYVTIDGDFSGREQAHAPNYTANLGFTFMGDGGFFARMDYQAVDDFYFSNSHDQRADSKQLLHAKVGYQAPQWALYAWGRNVLDERYAVRGFYFGVEPPNFEDTLYTHLGDPQHFGVTFEFDF